MLKSVKGGHLHHCSIVFFVGNTDHGRATIQSVMTLLNLPESLFLNRDELHKIVKLFLHILERLHGVCLSCLVVLILLVLLGRLF